MFEKKLLRSEMICCVLCDDAPCSRVCGKMDVSSLLRSIWFDDEKAAASRFPAENPCAGCPASCEAACVRPHEVPIRALMTRLHDEVKPELEIPLPENEDRLRTELCGVPLENPFLLSSSVVASTYDMCARAFEAGWAGAAFKTIPAPTWQTAAWVRISARCRSWWSVLLRQRDVEQSPRFSQSSRPMWRP